MVMVSHPIVPKPPSMVIFCHDVFLRVADRRRPSPELVARGDFEEELPGDGIDDRRVERVIGLEADVHRGW